MSTSNDFSPTGIKLEGQYENDRNAENANLYKAIIREVYGVTDVICGHHLVYEKEETRSDGFTYQIIEEIPSADALIFDHSAARKLWGESQYLDNLARLAREPIATRDKLLGELYNARNTSKKES